MLNVKLESVSGNGAGEINIFVHGFGRLKGPVLGSYLNMLRELRLRGRTYLLNWDSGLLWRPLVPVALLAGGILGYVAYRKLKGNKPAKDCEQESLLKSVSKIGLSAIPILPVAASIEFTLNKRKADFFGKRFQSFITDIPDVRLDNLNLIGFSLGARMIHTALHSCSWKDFNVKDICFLGGATETYSHDWIECLSKIHGYIYNFYSRHDDALKVKPDTEHNIGRHPIPLDDPRIINIETTLHHRRHPSYHDHLKELLQVLGPLTDSQE